MILHCAMAVNVNGGKSIMTVVTMVGLMTWQGVRLTRNILVGICVLVGK